MLILGIHDGHNGTMNIKKLDYKKALVTGGGGFIGSHIVEELLKRGLEVVSVDNLVTNDYTNTLIFSDNQKFQFECVDITNYDDLVPCFKDRDIVFHNAASKKTICLDNPMRDLEINAKGTYNVLKIAKKAGVKKFIHASTGSVYGEPIFLPTTEKHPTNPTSFYGISKLSAEKYVLLADMDTTILRYHHVYGTRQNYSDYGGVVSIFIRRLLQDKPPIIHGDGTQIRSFTYVKDVVNANLFVASLDNSKDNIFNVASGLKITINDLANTLMKLMNKHIEPIYDDWLEGDILQFNIDNSKLKKLGFKYQYSFDEGLINTIDWLKREIEK